MDVASPTPEEESVRLTWSGVRAGAVAIGPVAVSAGAFGLAFGVLAQKANLSLPAAALMSGLVFAGSAQMVALQLWTTPVSAAAVFLATVAMNARYVLMGAALRPWMGRLARRQSYPSLFLLGDGNWMVALRARASGRDGVGSLVGGGAVMYVAWVSATAVGHVLGSAVAAPQRFGLDFTLVAFCAAMVVGLWRGRGDIWPVLAAAVAALVTHRLVPGHWHILAGGLVGSLVGAWRQGADA